MHGLDSCGSGQEPVTDSYGRSSKYSCLVQQRRRRATTVSALYRNDGFKKKSQLVNEFLSTFLKNLKYAEDHRQ